MISRLVLLLSVVAVCLECVEGNNEHERGKRGKLPLRSSLTPHQRRRRRTRQLENFTYFLENSIINVYNSTVSIYDGRQISEDSVEAQKKTPKSAKSRGVYSLPYSKHSAKSHSKEDFSNEHSTKSHSRDFISPGIVLVAKTVPAVNGNPITVDELPNITNPIPITLDELPDLMPSLDLSSKPSFMPSSQPTFMPSSQPSLEPSSQPSLIPSSVDKRQEPLDSSNIYRTCTGPKDVMGIPQTSSQCSVLSEGQMFVNFDGVATQLSSAFEKNEVETVTLEYISHFFDNDEQKVRCISIIDVTALDGGSNNGKATAIEFNIVFEIDVTYVASIDESYSIPDSLSDCNPARRNLRISNAENFDSEQQNHRRLQCSYSLLLVCNACNSINSCYCPCDRFTPRNRYYIRSSTHWYSRAVNNPTYGFRQTQTTGPTLFQIAIENPVEEETSCADDDYLCFVRDSVESLQDATGTNAIIAVDSTTTLAQCSINRFNIKNGKKPSLTCNEYNEELLCDLVPGEDFEEDEEECTKGTTNTSRDSIIPVNL